MYIVAGMPVIAWEKSAAARFIKENQIGFTIKTLNDLDSYIKQIRPDDYESFVNNCLKVREKIINGYNLRKAIKSIESSIIAK